MSGRPRAIGEYNSGGRDYIMRHSGTDDKNVQARALEDVRRSRLLLVSEVYPPTIGGSGMLMQGIYSRIEDARVTVLTDGHGTSGDTVEHGVAVLRRPLATSTWGLLSLTGLRAHVRLAWRIWRLLPRRDGIVHCARALPEGVAARLSNMIGGPGYVCWAHGEDLATARASREFTFLTSWVFRGARAALANSRNTAEMLGAFGVPQDIRHVVYPAVDANRFRPDVDGADIRRLYAAPGDILLLSVGRLQRRKGHDVMIRAIAALSQDLPGLRYVIAGDGDERTRLEQLADEHHVRDRVFFPGPVRDETLPAYYTAADIFVLPNRIDDDGDIEGFGIVFLEASAAGRPVIGGRSGGVPEAVEDGVTGVLVDGSDVEAVAAAIRELAVSPEKRHRMGRDGRARVLERFTWDQAARSVSDLHRRLMRAR
jgi:phosphatidylinositol alpha-1,6-mannosyltransferase